MTGILIHIETGNDPTTIFKTKPKSTPTKAEAVAMLRDAITIAASHASQSGIAAREIASTLEAQASFWTQRGVMTRPVL